MFKSWSQNSIKVRWAKSHNDLFPSIADSLFETLFCLSLLLTALILSAASMQGSLHASHTKHLFLPLYSSSIPILEHSLIPSPTYPAPVFFFKSLSWVFFNPQFSYLISFCTVCMLLNIILLLYHTGSPQHVSHCSCFHESFIFINHLSTSRCIYKYRDCGKL